MTFPWVMVLAWYVKSLLKISLLKLSSPVSMYLIHFLLRLGCAKFFSSVMGRQVFSSSSSNSSSGSCAYFLIVQSFPGGKYFCRIWFIFIIIRQVGKTWITLRNFNLFHLFCCWSLCRKLILQFHNYLRYTEIKNSEWPLPVKCLVLANQKALLQCTRKFVYDISPCCCIVNDRIWRRLRFCFTAVKRFISLLCKRNKLT